MDIKERFFINPYSDHDKTEYRSIEDFVDVSFWRNWALETGLECLHRLKPKASSKYCDGSVYTGNTGLIFVSYKMLKSGYYPKYSTHFQTYMKECLLANETYYNSVSKRDSYKSAFILGYGGMVAMGILVSKILGLDNADFYIKRYAELASNVMPISFLSKGADELFVGRAGYLCGHLLLSKCFQNLEVVPKSDLHKICDIIVQSGREYARENNTPSPLMYSYHGTEYLGAAHGLAGILQILISFPEYLQLNPEAERDIKHSIDFYYTIQKSNGNFPCAMDEDHQLPRNENKDLVHWCHGAGGVLFLFAKAYMQWRETKYLDMCIRCGEFIWQRGLLRKGPGICHGIAGNGYTQLILYRITNDVKYLYRASKFAEFLLTDIFKKEARTPDSPFSLFEGLGGTVCFILDLLNPNNADFPLVPIF